MPLDRTSDDFFMSEALKLAQRAFDAEEVPVGTVIVHVPADAPPRIIARAHNQVEQLKDATAHAEMLAITQAEAALGDWRLTDCTLYVTKEPCPMCAGAILLTRVKRLVFGCADERAGAAGSKFSIAQSPVLSHTVTVQSGLCADECGALLREFFKAQRLKDKGI
jgi:tRNA(adenine34) deaminase